MRLDIEFDGLEKLRAAMARAPQVVEQELTAFMHAATLHLKAEIQELTPKGAGGLAGHGLHASWDNQVETLAPGVVQGVVGSAQPHAIYVELGTKPHFPPPKALVPWVQAKLGIQEEPAALGVAFLVARKIAQRGTLGVGMAHRALAANTAQIQRQFEAAVGRALARVAGGAA